MMRKILLHAIILSVIALVFGWFFWMVELSWIIAFCKGIDSSIQIENHHVGMPFNVLLQNIIPWVIMPWIVFFACWVIVYIKQREWSVKLFYSLFSFVLLGNFVFVGLFLIRLYFGVKTYYTYTLPGVINPIYVHNLNPYLWRIFGAALFAGVFILLTRKKRIPH